MQQTGNIFNPEYIFIDKKKNLVYRKEQFTNLKILPTELIIADRRYRKEEIKEIIKDFGFKILDSRYVQAGRWGIELKATDEKAKEIFIVAIKEGYLQHKIKVIFKLVNKGLAFFFKPFNDLFSYIENRNK